MLSYISWMQDMTFVQFCLFFIVQKQLFIFREFFYNTSSKSIELRGQILIEKQGSTVVYCLKYMQHKKRSQ